MMKIILTILLATSFISHAYQTANAATYSYDPLGRLIMVIYNSGGEVLTYRI